jgi:hypothetical protein
MRAIIIITFLFCIVARANPIGFALSAADRVYIASERLTVTVSPDVAELKGTFVFRYRQDVRNPGQKSFVMLEIPIWFPETHPRDPSVAAFWRSFPKDDITTVSPQNRAAFEKAVGLRVSLDGESLPIGQFSTLTSTNSRQRWAAREWQQEAGFCCLVFRFYFTDDSALAEKPLTVAYRQPLLEEDGVGKFFYLPTFQNLPKDISTTDTNRYAITVAAQPGCSLTVSNGDQQRTLETGQGFTLSPKHNQPIKAVARPTSRSRANAAFRRRSSGLPQETAGG